QRGPERLADRGRRELRGRIQRSGNDAAAGERARDHVVAGAALEQVWERRTDREGHAEHVRQHHLSPVLDGALEEAARPATTGVREHGVDSPEAVEAGSDEAFDFGPLAHVTGDADRVLIAEFVGQVAQRPLTAGPEHEPEATRSALP